MRLDFPKKTLGLCLLLQGEELWRQSDGFRLSIGFMRFASVNVKTEEEKPKDA